MLTPNAITVTHNAVMVTPNTVILTPNAVMVTVNHSILTWWLSMLSWLHLMLSWWCSDDTRKAIPIILCLLSRLFPFHKTNMTVVIWELQMTQVMCSQNDVGIGFMWYPQKFVQNNYFDKTWNHISSCFHVKKHIIPKFETKKFFKYVLHKR